LVGSFKIEVSFAKHSLFHRALLQKRPMFLGSLLIVATPYKSNKRRDLGSKTHIQGDSWAVCVFSLILVVRVSYVCFCIMCVFLCCVCVIVLCVCFCFMGVSLYSRLVNVLCVCVSLCVCVCRGSDAFS